MMTDVRMDRSRADGIVGRDVELEVLLRSAAGRDDTRMVLLSGDAGVGKTRVLTEALDRLTRDGWRALVGHCLDFGETSMPYLPFAEMLAQIGEVAPELAERELHPALARLRHRAPADEPSEGLDRAEVFEAMYALVEELAALGPIALVVEDAHWADASTRDLVSFLLARRIPGRCLFVVTFRSDEMHRRHPLRKRVAEWVRLPGVDRLQLEPLPAGDVRGMVEQILGSAGRPLGEKYDDDIERIVQRSQGNAFYVEELVGAFLGGGWSLPEDLADLLLVRLDRLDESARDVVRVASAAGQRVPHDLLARVAPVTEDQLEVALRTAIDANVLVRTGDSEYAFRHALLGEAVYEDLLPGERMRLHTAYAEAVRELHGTRGAADLARHALASHDLPTALQASVDAGDQALATGGPDEAARHFTKALEIYAARLVAARRPARRGRAGGPHRRCAVRLGPSRDGPVPHRLPPLAPARRRTAARAGAAAARAGRGAALHGDRHPAEPGQRRGPGARRTRTHSAAGTDPRHARAGADLGRSFRRGQGPGGRGDRARRPARAAAPRR